MLQHVLETEGFEVKCFSAPAEFLKYMKRNRPACVLLDVNMPDMNGLQVLSRLALMESKTPVIVISAEDDMTNARTALNYGASSFIRKPVDPGRLLRRIREIVAPQPDQSDGAL